MCINQGTASCCTGTLFAECPIPKLQDAPLHTVGLLSASGMELLKVWVQDAVFH